MNSGHDPRLVNVGGVLVQKDALRISERISEYDPNLRVQYLESEAAVGEPPFRIVERCYDGIDRIVFTCWQLDGRVLARIMNADTKRHNVLNDVEENNRKMRENDRRRYQAKIEEANEIAHAVLKSPKTTYTVRDPDTGELLKFTS